MLELSFKDYLEEKLVTFGKKAYPKYGQFIIMAGGSGSGKGFVIKNLLGIEAKIVDVDAAKSLAMRAAGISKKIEAYIGKPVKQINLKNPEDVRSLHIALNDVIGVIGNKESVLKQAIAQTKPELLPNIIFDVTLKEYSKFENLTGFARMAGYAPENIHLVWVVNDVSVAAAQNEKRARTVPKDILIASHEGVSLNMKKIYDMSSGVASHMNGDIWFVFNNSNQDTTITKSDSGGSYVSAANYFKVKAAGRPAMIPIPDDILEKIKSYTPKIKTW